jgi:hypothetical protein
MSLRVVSASGLVTDIQGDSSLIIFNSSGVAIAKGRAVFLNGASTNTFGVPPQRIPSVVLASASDPTKMPAVGLMVQSANSGAVARVLTEGILDMDTSAWPAGTRLFVGDNGLLTNIAPSDRAQRVAIVIRSAAADGFVWVSTKVMSAQDEGTLLPSAGGITTHTLLWDTTVAIANKYLPNPRPAKGYYRYVGPTDPATLSGVTLKNGDSWEQTF